jgi:hypothetical protein
MAPLEREGVGACSQSPSLLDDNINLRDGCARGDGQVDVGKDTRAAGIGILVDKTRGEDKSPPGPPPGSATTLPRGAGRGTDNIPVGDLKVLELSLKVRLLVLTTRALEMIRSASHHWR